MRIVLAPDSFKESMTAREAARAMAEGVKDADPRARTVLAPMSDGGEGFVDAVAAAWGADLVDADTVDALGRPIRAVYGLSGGRAVMDVAGCAGLELIAPADRDVLRSSTAGLGLLMRDALRRGARTILLGIGGSATNDAGVGMLHALGAGLLDADGRPLAPRPDQLDRLAAIDASALAPLLGGATIRVACDVTNPLTGPNGATAVFGPQKGATADLVPRLERALERVARVSGHRDQADAPGSGAAGGLGFALRAFLGAELEPGAELVARQIALPEAVRGADLVLTGEGTPRPRRARRPPESPASPPRPGWTASSWPGASAPGPSASCAAGRPRSSASARPTSPWRGRCAAARTICAGRSASTCGAGARTPARLTRW